MGTRVAARPWRCERRGIRPVAARGGPRRPRARSVHGLESSRARVFRASLTRRHSGERFQPMDVRPSVMLLWRESAAPTSLNLTTRLQQQVYEETWACVILEGDAGMRSRTSKRRAPNLRAMKTSSTPWSAPGSGSAHCKEARGPPAIMIRRYGFGP